MQFIYTHGPWREFRGYVFAWGKPTDVKDQATINALSTNPLFKRIEDEIYQAPQAKAIEAPASPKVLDPHACPKCGRIVKQGKVLHIRWCRGKK